MRFPGKKRLPTRYHTQTRRRFLGLFERLEQRIVLTNYTNVPLSDSQMQDLLAGADGLVQLSTDLSTTGRHSEPMRGIVFDDSHGSQQVSLGDLTPYGEGVEQAVANPLRDFYGNYPAQDRTTDSLIVHLSNVDGVTVTGGLDDVSNEIRFEFHIRLESDLTFLRADFGSPGRELGIGVQNGGELSGQYIVDIRFDYGMRNDRSLSVEQRIFLENLTIDASILASATLNPMTIGIGVLEASVPSFTLDARLEVHIGPVDPIERTELSEIRDGTALQQFNTEFAANSINSTLEAQAMVGRWRLEGAPVLQMIGDFVGIEPAITFSADLSEAFLFNRISTQDMAAGMEQLGAWLSAWSDSSVYAIDIPFTSGATVGSVYDAGAAHGNFISSLRDGDGAATFDSAQDFPYSGANGIDYDPATDRLSFVVVRNSASQRTHSRSTRVYSDIDALGLNSPAEIEIEADGTIGYVVSFDLTDESQPIADRLHVSELELATTIVPTISGVTGDAAYHDLGISFADASMAGSYTVHSTIGDPNPSVTSLSLASLYQRLSDPTTLLREPIDATGSTELRLTGLSVIDNLFYLAADASVVATVPSILTGVVDLALINAPDLSNFENVSFADMTDSLQQAVRGMSDWDGQGDEALATIGQRIKNFNEVRQEQVADAIDEAEDVFESAFGAGRAILQDLPGFARDLAVSTTSGALSFTSNLTYNSSQELLEWFVNAASSSSRTVDVGLGFESLYDYTGHPNVEQTNNFVGTTASVQAETDSTMAVGLELDVSNANQPATYLNSRSKFETSIYVNATPATGSAVVMDGASGALGMQLTDGSLVVAQNVQIPNANSPARFTAALPGGMSRVALGELGNLVPSLNTVGRMRFDAGVIPATTGRLESDRLNFRVNNLALPSSSTVLATSPSFPVLRQGIDLLTQLSALPEAIDRLLLNLEEQLRDNVFSNHFPLIGDALDGPANFVRDIRLEVKQRLQPLTVFDIVTIEQNLELAIANLVGRVDNFIEFISDPQLPDQIRIHFDFSSVLARDTIPVETNIGLPALGIDWDASVIIAGEYDFAIDIVVDKHQGIYLDTTTENLGIGFNVNLDGGATGRLGFLEVTATAKAIDNPSCPHAFEAIIGIGIQDPSSEGKLFPDEALSVSIIDPNDTGLTGCAGLGFEIEATATEWLPTLRTDLYVDWEFDGSDLNGQTPEITYENVQIKLGAFFDNVFLPLLRKIEALIDPVEPVLDLLTKPIPILKDYVADINLLELMELYLSLYPDTASTQRYETLLEFINVLTAVNKLANKAAAEASTTGFLDIGRLSFGGPLSVYDARLSELSSTLIKQAAIETDIQEQFANLVPKTEGEIRTTPLKVEFPILENPASVFEWLLGLGDPVLVAVDLPGIIGDFPINKSIPVLPGLSVELAGSIDFSAGVSVGLDTYGGRRYRETGDKVDLLQGFYISDRSRADGTGSDVNEINLNVNTFLGLGVGFDVADVGIKASVLGGVVGGIGVDLIDPDGDGKQRGHEFSSPQGCLGINGTIGVSAELHASLGPVRWEIPFASEELGSFNEIVHCTTASETNANLARLHLQTGELELLMGPLAALRSVNKDSFDESFSVTVNGEEITVSAFGFKETFSSLQVLSLRGDGGDGNDRITVDASFTKPANLLGGDGDDYLQGGSANDTLDGGAGDDTLYGGAGGDTLHGQEGDDKLYGQAGIDTLHGHAGSDRIYGGTEKDFIFGEGGVNYLYGEDGEDELTGGNATDYIYGGIGNDLIFGLGGPDVLLGEDGIDEIWGGNDDDLIDGGADADLLYGQAGADTIYGQSGIDIVHGHAGDDYIDGGDDDDQLFGDEGYDTLFGGLGHDRLRGGANDDLLYGGDDLDRLRGEGGNDTLYGEAHNDDLFGGEGIDVIYGGAGTDQIYGGPGNDELYGEDGSDQIFGNDDSLNEDRSDPSFTDDDVIDGGAEADTITGGWGTDRILGGPDNDTIAGNEGDDWIEGQAGDDSLYGQDAPDHLRSQSDGADEIYGGDGDDTIGGGAESDLLRGGKGDDTIQGDDGNDQLFGEAGHDVIHGGNGQDTIDGAAGNDQLSGGIDLDTIYGGEGLDTIEGNDGDDFLSGNDHADIIYADDGQDEVLGGLGNDTLRGGNDDDLLNGDEGDDLILGNAGRDTIHGNSGNDVLYGGTQNDTIQGGLGQDRIYGELGDDVLSGNEDDDIVEGGAGDDAIEGNAGADSLYGDSGEDTISGGLHNDYLFAGDGVSNLLNGDEGNDWLIGSDDGQDDPKPLDASYFGDRLNGGDGDDTIDGLGGGDLIDGGSGTNLVRSGTHKGSLVNGIEVAVQTTFSMPAGPERRGPWAELSRSANDGGLTEVGGFEQSLFATELGVYVAWVDWRNGNSEIYVAFHAYDVGHWTALVGFSGANSASGGGISNDAQQSRRPTLFKTDSSESLIVAWTSIAEDGTSSIEVAREDSNWGRLANPAQTGTADHASFVSYGDHSGLLFWLDDELGSEQSRVNVSQYIHAAGCFSGFRPGQSVINLSNDLDVKSFDAAAVSFRAAVALAYGTASDQDVAVVVGSGVLATEATLCPGMPNASIQEYVLQAWSTLYTETVGDTQNPDIGMQLIEQRGVPGEEQLGTDIVVAWELSDDRQNQVDGIVVQMPVEGGAPNIAQLIPEYYGEAARQSATTLSQTTGYAAKPSVAMSWGGTFVGWMDDGVQAAQNRSSIFVLARERNTTSSGPYVVREAEPLDASGRGISQTGGSLQSLTLEVPRDGFFGSYPYAAWTEAATPMQTDVYGNNVYLRVTQPGLQLVDDRFLGRKNQGANGNVLANDLNLFGEGPAVVTEFDGRALPKTGTLEFTSPLGAKVKVSSNGSVVYDTQGVNTFRRLKRGESLRESFTYQVDNLIHRAEAIVEFVIFGDNKFRNPNNEADVNNDSFLSPIDVLLLINDINQSGSRALAEETSVDRYFPDVNDDGSITAIDVLMVINWLNSTSGEGEAPQCNLASNNHFVSTNHFDTFWLTGTSRTFERSQWLVPEVEVSKANTKRRLPWASADDEGQV